MATCQTKHPAWVPSSQGGGKEHENGEPTRRPKTSKEHPGIRRGNWKI